MNTHDAILDVLFHRWACPKEILFSAIAPHFWGDLRSRAMYLFLHEAGETAEQIAANFEGQTPENVLLRAKQVELEARTSAPEARLMNWYINEIYQRISTGWKNEPTQEKQSS